MSVNPPIEERLPAPELVDSLDWVNAPAQRLQAHRGRIVLLAFWHAGQAIGHSLLDELVQLAGRFGDSLSLIAIHAPRFDRERDARTVLKAVNRLGLRAPVASDPACVAWQHFGIRAWPSVVLIDARSRVVAVEEGDGLRAALAQRIDALMEEALLDGSLVYESLPASVRAEPRMPLAFPAGLAVTTEHLYVADCGHHRLLECSHEGRILRQFGSGTPGLLDGNAGEAAFRSPRGVTLLDDALYVADTGNHALRRVRLRDGSVDTLAGNGQSGTPAFNRRELAAAELPLDAPWDVVGHFDRLFLAMAGARQIWEFNLGDRRLRVLAGSGKFGQVDGAGSEAAFAQPAALALVQQTLYVADALGSAVRTVHLTSGHVQTLVGQGLYEFGDEDGPRNAARLQCPQGLCLDPRAPVLWIADTYNDAIRMLRFGGGELRRIDPGHRLHGPTGIAALPGALFVSNSEAHEVLRIDLEAGSTRRLPLGE